MGILKSLCKPNMFRCLFTGSAVLILTGLLTHFALADDSAYAPLWLYQGSWNLKDSKPTPTSNSVRLDNQCAVVGTYFACQQTVDGKVDALLVFIPSEKLHEYYTQSILPKGFSTGRGELRIDGEQWTYSSDVKENGKTTHYRTVNVFSRKNHIHYEQLVSEDGVKWKVTDSGDEVRVLQDP